VKRIVGAVLCFLLLPVIPGCSPVQVGPPSPLTILLTNDDGWDQHGIEVMHNALLHAGHHVILVAPAQQRSGSGGSISADLGNPHDLVRESPGVWHFDGTPADCVQVALDLGIAAPETDLVISGTNFGQNLGIAADLASGTIGAANKAWSMGIPAIAVSAGILLEERGMTPPFPSTTAAQDAAADYVVRLLDAMPRDGKGRVELAGVLNINVPAPPNDIRGAVYAPLADRSPFRLVWQDTGGTVQTGSGELVLKPEFGPEPDEGVKDDAAWFSRGFITVTHLGVDSAASAPHSPLPKLPPAGTP